MAGAGGKCAKIMFPFLWEMNIRWFSSALKSLMKKQRPNVYIPHFTFLLCCFRPCLLPEGAWGGYHANPLMDCVLSLFSQSSSQMFPCSRVTWRACEPLVTGSPSDSVAQQVWVGAQWLALLTRSWETPRVLVRGPHFENYHPKSPSNLSSSVIFPPAPFSSLLMILSHCYKIPDWDLVSVLLQQGIVIFPFWT